MTNITAKIKGTPERLVARISQGTFADIIRLWGEHMKRTGKKISKENFIEDEIFIPFIKSKATK